MALASVPVAADVAVETGQGRALTSVGRLEHWKVEVAVERLLELEGIILLPVAVAVERWFAALAIALSFLVLLLISFLTVLRLFL